MDLFWVQTLASAKYKDGQWLLPDPDLIQQKAHKAMLETIKTLHEQLVILVSAYNENSTLRKHLKLLPVYNRQGNVMTGITLMQSMVQLRLERKGNSLEATLESMQGFRKIQELIHTFKPRIDGLGGLSWIMDDKSIMTNEMIIKQLLHDICSCAFELGAK